MLRSHAIEFYFWSLFLPDQHRGAIQALLAFDTEIARIPVAVSETSLGEIRYQWWRDAVISMADNQSSGHPVIAVLGPAMKRYSLPHQPLLDLIDARVFDLYDDPMPDLNSLEGYFGETFGTLIRLVSIILSDGRDTGSGSLAGHAGVAIGIQKVLEDTANFGEELGKFFPRDLVGPKKMLREDLSDVEVLRSNAMQHLDAAVDGWKMLPDYVKPAYLPLAISRKVLMRRRWYFNSERTVVRRLSTFKCLTTLLSSYFLRRL